MEDKTLSDSKRLRIISMSSTKLLERIKELKGPSSSILLELTERNEEMSKNIPGYKKDFYDIQQKNILEIYHIFNGIETACHILEVKLESFGYGYVVGVKQ